MLAENLVNWAKKEQMEGEQRGRLGEARDYLRAQLRFKFGDLPERIEIRIEQAGHDQLKGWMRDVLFADSLEDMFNH